MNLEELLRPLAGALPCGEDMMFSTKFDRIAEARRADDPSLAQGEWIVPLKDADWKQVIAIGTELLTGRTKDLRIAVWMAEALARTHGLRGLANGYALTEGLCTSSWEGLHPQPEDGEYEQRIGSLEWLAAQTVRLARELPLTHSPQGQYSSLDFEAARALALNVERNPSEAETLLREARVTMAQFDAARRDTPPAFLRDSLEAAQQTLARIEFLRRTLESRLGDDAPSFAAAAEAVDALRRRFARYLAEQPAPAEQSARTRGESAATPRTEPTLVARAGAAPPKLAELGPVRSRAQAIRQLEEIAAFFRQTEPHSPVAYLADKAARWGTMPLHAWLRSVLKDESALLQVEELLGVDGAPSEPEQAG